MAAAAVFYTSAKV